MCADWQTDCVGGRRQGRLWVEWVDSIESTNLALMQRPVLVPDGGMAGGARSGPVERMGAIPQAGLAVGAEAALQAGLTEGTGAGLQARQPGSTAKAPGMVEAPAAVWLMAGEQTGGRGRRGKVWRSLPGEAMTASFGRELAPGQLESPGVVPLVAGIVVAEFLQTLGVSVRVKWPNDLCLLRDDAVQPLAKVGGILCEMRSRGTGSRLVIGCGLNLLGVPQGLETDQAVASLFRIGRDGFVDMGHAQASGALRGDAPDIVGGVGGASPEGAPVLRSWWKPAGAAMAGVTSGVMAAMTAEALMQQVALGVGEVLLAGTDQLLAEGFAAFAARWQRLDVLAGRPVRVHHADGVRDAVVLGIDTAGGLQVRYEDGGDGVGPGSVVTLMAEQVSIRPRVNG